jgi:hypothetical protein
MLLLQSEEEMTGVDFGRGIAVNKKVREIGAEYDIHHDKNEDEAQNTIICCVWHMMYLDY